MPNVNAIAKTGKLPGMMGAGMMGAALPGRPDAEKPSLEKVKDLLQQAMDMLAALGANDIVPGEPAGPAMPAPRPRPPMAPRPGNIPPMM